MNNEKPAKFKEGQYFIQNVKKKVFRIVNAEWKGTITKPSRSKVKPFTTQINDWLYDIEYVSPSEEKEVKYGRYYENRLINECSLIVDQKLPKAIYE